VPEKTDRAAQIIARKNLIRFILTVGRTKEKSK
jgi:hypothetical protein